MFPQLGLTRLFGRRWDGEAEVGAVFTVQPPFVLLPPPSHPVQTHACSKKKKKNKLLAIKILGIVSYLYDPLLLVTFLKTK